MTRAIVLGDKPVIGAIRGWAGGGGLEWVINCDFAIAAEGTRFFFPEISWAFLSPAGSPKFCRASWAFSGRAR